MTEQRDRGSPILIEATYVRTTPFGTQGVFNPTTATISVTNPDGGISPDGASLTDSGTTGKFFYNLQTGIDWPVGPYRVKVTGSDGTNTDVTINPRAFDLK